MFMILFLYMLFASTFTIGKAAMDYAQPVFFVGIRMIVGGLLLLMYQYFFNRSQWRLDKSDIFLFVQMMVFHIGLSFSCEFWSLQFVSPAKVGLLWNLSPFVTAMMAYASGKEYMTIKKWLGLAIGFIGLLPSLVSSAPEELATGSIAFLSFPEIVLFVAVLSASYAWILMKHLVVDKHYSPVMVNGIAMLGGGFFALIVSFFVESAPYITLAPRFGPHCDASLSSLLCSLFSFEYAGFVLFLIYMFALILIANVGCFNLYAYLLKSYSATFISFCGFTTPLFAALFDWLFRGETVGVAFLLSVAVVSFGLFIFYQEELALVG